MAEPICKCGHSRAQHEVHDGYKPFGWCNFQYDLCGCRGFVDAVSEPRVHTVIEHDHLDSGDPTKWKIVHIDDVTLSPEQVEQIKAFVGAQACDYVHDDERDEPLTNLHADDCLRCHVLSILGVDDRKAEQ